MYVRLSSYQNGCSGHDKLRSIQRRKSMNMNRKEMTPGEIRELKIRRNRIKRQRQLRRRIVIAIAAVIIIVSSSLGLTSILSKAAETPDEYKIKTYSSVMMPFGSDLYELAAQYMDSDYYDSCEDYIKEVRFINHLDEDETVQAGYYVILPRYIEEF